MTLISPSAIRLNIGADHFSKCSYVTGIASSRARSLRAQLVLAAVGLVAIDAAHREPGQLVSRLLVMRFASLAPS